jgi:hypothetical protein
MRTPSDAPDPFALGRKVETPKPTAAPAPVAPGVVRGADGRLATTAPAPVPIVWIPTPREEDEA